MRKSLETVEVANPVRIMRPSIDHLCNLSVDSEDQILRIAERDCYSPLISLRQVVPELNTDLLKLQRLGKGTTSNVYMAIHVGTLDVVALKEIEIRTQADRATVRSELEALKSQRSPLMHRNFTSECGACPYIVKFYGSAMPLENMAVLAVEYIGGGNLQDWIDRKTPAPEPWLAHVAYQCLLALQYVHRQNRSHSDVKPANILVTREGDAKVADFGCASGGVGRTMVGTRRYMAPERLKGETNITKSDVWSFGVAIAAAALAECPAVQAHSEFDQVHEADGIMNFITSSGSLSEELLSFLGECLYVDPIIRASIDELLEHPFLRRSNKWEMRCPEVLTFIESNRLKPWLPINEIVTDIANARKDRNLDNASIPLSSLRSLAAALDSTVVQLADEFKKHSGNKTPPSGILPSPFSPIAATLGRRPHSSAELPQYSTHRKLLRPGMSNKDLRKKALMANSVRALAVSNGSSSIKGNDIESIALRMQRSLDIRDRYYRFRRYKHCFVGSAAVAWLIENGEVNDAKTALTLGNEMVRMGIFSHVCAAHLFEDDNLFYRFSDKWREKLDSQLRKTQQKEKDHKAHRRTRSFSAVSLMGRSTSAGFPAMFTLRSLSTAVTPLAHGENDGSRNRVADLFHVSSNSQSPVLNRFSNVTEIMNPMHQRRPLLQRESSHCHEHTGEECSPITMPPLSLPSRDQLA